MSVGSLASAGLFRYLCTRSVPCHSVARQANDLERRGERLQVARYVVERAPTFWERIQALTGVSIDLGTERIRDRMEAATFVYEIRRALDALGIDDARSLTIDGAVVFNDALGKPGDMPELAVAFLDHTSTFGDTFEELRLSVEHDEDGLHLEVEGLVTSEHRRQEPSARITVLGSLLGLEPYRGLVATQIAEGRLHFERFASRLAEALRRHLPEGAVATTVEEVGLVQVAKRHATAEPANPRSTSVETASPPRNFTLSLEQRIAATVIGVPPYALRARKVEDLEAALVAELVQLEATEAVPLAITRNIARLNALIEDHNRYYPMESNLPIDVASGRILDLLGEPWKPLPVATTDSLRALSRAPARDDP